MNSKENITHALRNAYQHAPLVQPARVTLRPFPYVTDNLITHRFFTLTADLRGNYAGPTRSKSALLRRAQQELVIGFNLCGLPTVKVGPDALDFQHAELLRLDFLTKDDPRAFSASASIILSEEMLPTPEGLLPNMKSLQQLAAGIEGSLIHACLFYFSQNIEGFFFHFFGHGSLGFGPLTTIDAELRGRMQASEKFWLGFRVGLDVERALKANQIEPSTTPGNPPPQE